MIANTINTPSLDVLSSSLLTGGICMGHILPPDNFVLEYKPVPGIPVCKYVPFLPKDSFAPLGPTDVLIPPLLKFKCTPGAILILLRKFQAIQNTFCL